MLTPPFGVPLCCCLALSVRVAKGSDPIFEREKTSLYFDKRISRTLFRTRMTIQIESEESLRSNRVLFFLSFWDEGTEVFELGF